MRGVKSAAILLPVQWLSGSVQATRLFSFNTFFSSRRFAVPLHSISRHMATPQNLILNYYSTEGFLLKASKVTNSGFNFNANSRPAHCYKRTKDVRAALIQNRPLGPYKDSDRNPRFTKLRFPLRSALTEQTKCLCTYKLEYQQNYWTQRIQLYVGTCTAVQCG